MSRLSSLSSSAIKAMFSSETEETLIMLLTIYDPNIKTSDVPVIRLCDNYNKRLSITTDTEVYYGVRSRGNEYMFLPMQITLPTDQEAGSDRCSITLNYVTEEAITLIRTQLNGPTKILLELVLTKTPSYNDGQTDQEPDLDTVEASFPNFYITSVTYNAESITFELNMISYNREPFPSYNFVPSYFPGLF